MPAREIKELRKAGKLKEAYEMAAQELAAEPENIWAKRNLSWVLYDYLKANAETADTFPTFLHYMNEVQTMNLPANETMFYENLSWQVGKMAFKLSNVSPVQVNRVSQLLQIVKTLPLPKPGESYSFLYNAFHKGLKDSNEYLGFADWWDFQNFQPQDFEKEKLENAREIMAIVEQAYIAYAKHLLPKPSFTGQMEFDEDKARLFLPALEQVVETYPQFQYPPYFYAKLLLALGEKDNSLSALLPFARKKKNDFWVWQVLADAFADDEEKVFAFYCKALSCRSPEEMLVNLREKMAALLVAKELYNEAKTEIELLVKTRKEKGFRIPHRVIDWQNSAWYAEAEASASNRRLYKTYLPMAEEILYADVPEELVFVEFVNRNRKILNFIKHDQTTGFFKYERFLDDAQIGDVLRVRFQSSGGNGLSRALTVEKHEDDDFAARFSKKISGKLRMKGTRFGFLGDAFVSPAVVSEFKLTDGMSLQATAIKAYNREKKQWGWKVVDAMEVLHIM